MVLFLVNIKEICSQVISTLRWASTMQFPRLPTRCPCLHTCQNNVTKVFVLVLVFWPNVDNLCVLRDSWQLWPPPVNKAASDTGERAAQAFKRILNWAKMAEWSFSGSQWQLGATVRRREEPGSLKGRLAWGTRTTKVSRVVCSSSRFCLRLCVTFKLGRRAAQSCNAAP